MWTKEIQVEKNEKHVHNGPMLKRSSVYTCTVNK